MNYLSRIEIFCVPILAYGVLLLFIFLFIAGIIRAVRVLKSTNDAGIKSIYRSASIFIGLLFIAIITFFSVAIIHYMIYQTPL